MSKPQTIIYTEDLGEAPYAHPVRDITEFIHTVRVAMEDFDANIIVASDGVVVGAWELEHDGALDGTPWYTLTRDPRHL